MVLTQESVARVEESYAGLERQCDESGAGKKVSAATTQGQSCSPISVALDGASLVSLGGMTGRAVVRRVDGKSWYRKQ